MLPALETPSWLDSYLPGSCKAPRNSLTQSTRRASKRVLAIFRVDIGSWQGLRVRQAIVDACKKGQAVARVCLGSEGACVEPVRLRAPW